MAYFAINLDGSNGNIPWLMMEFVAGGSLLDNLMNGKIRKVSRFWYMYKS